MKLMGQYQQGLGCAEGVSAAFGATLDQLEYRWKQESLGIDVGGLVLGNLAPYLILLLLLVLPVGLVFLPRSSARQGGKT